MRSHYYALGKFILRFVLIAGAPACVSFFTQWTPMPSKGHCYGCAYLHVEKGDHVPLDFGAEYSRCKFTKADVVIWQLDSAYPTLLRKNSISCPRPPVFWGGGYSESETFLLMDGTVGDIEAIEDRPV